MIDTSQHANNTATVDSGDTEKIVIVEGGGHNGSSHLYRRYLPLRSRRVLHPRRRVQIDTSVVH